MIRSYLKLRFFLELQRGRRSALIWLCLLCCPVGILPVCSAVTLSHQATLPNIGMAGATILSLSQEQQLGEQHKQYLRRHFNFINDPLLNEYLNHLGKKIARHTTFPLPFHFYLIHSPSINAFATFGGNIYLYSGLLQLTETESQLASVMAHEISHVTQRHLASYLEKRKAATPLTLLATASALLLSRIHSDVGMALLTSTFAGNVQQQLSFTQQHEREADTLGLTLLIHSGFEPEGMVEFMTLLAEQDRFSQRPPEILMTHPLPDTRISYARNRITLLAPFKIHSSLEYYLAKIRLNYLITISQTPKPSSLSNPLLQNYERGNPTQQIAALYGETLLQLHLKNFIQAQQLVTQLLQTAPNNIWFLDLSADIHLALQQSTAAIKQLTNALRTQPHQSVLQLNLIQAYIAAANYSAAASLLHRYTYAYPEDLNGWGLGVKLYGKTGQLAERYAALAELVVRQGDIERAIKLLITASQHASIESDTQARIDARIDQLHNLQQNLSK